MSAVPKSVLASAPMERAHSERAGWIAGGAITALAAFVFLWQLGSSSLFIDEALSINHTRGDLDSLLSSVRRFETSPYTYPLLLDRWTAVFGTSDWAARLPSALAAVGLVLAVWRLGSLVAGATAGLLAAALTAISPLVLQYAQQARAYALLMLVATVAVLAAIEAERRASARWLVVSALAGVAALSLHYVALLVVVPLALWIGVRTSFSRPARAGFCGAAGLAFLAWLPLTLEQYGEHPEGGVSAYGSLTLSHAVRVVGAPFDTRYAYETGPAVVAGAVLLLVAVALLLRSFGSRRSSELELVAGIAVAVPGGLLAVALLGKDLLISRYAAVGVPFMLIALSAGITLVRRPFAVPLAAIAVTAAIAGTIGSHRSSGFYADTRAVAARIAEEWRPGDLVAHETSFGVDYTLRYYAAQRLPRTAQIVGTGDPQLRRHIANGGRLWLLTFQPQARTPGLGELLRRHEVVDRERFPGADSLNLLLSRPVSPPRQ